MIPVNLTACPSGQEEKDVKHKIRSTATATGEKCDKKKNDGGSLTNYGYFGSGKLQLGTLMLTPPPLKYFGLTKSSH